jgi:hypothetical protein
MKEKHTQILTYSRTHTQCAELLRDERLRGWERLFIATLQKSRNPGRKQLEKLEAIASRLGYSLTKEGGER